MMTGPGLIPTFLYYFVGTTLIVAFVVSQQTDVSLTTSAPYQVGTLFGLLAGLTGAYFNRSVTMTESFVDAPAFTKKLVAALTDMGFEAQSTIDAFTVYERSSLSRFFSLKLLVQLEPNTATIAGRSNTIKQLRQRLEA